MNNRTDIEITDKYAHDFRNMKVSDIESQIMMLPSIRKQDTLEIPSPTSHRYRPGNANRPRSSSHNHKYEHGIEMKKRIKPTEYSYNAYAENGKILEGPIDLSASNNVKVEPESDENGRVHQHEVKSEIDIEDRRVKLQKNKQKKRKSSLSTDENWTIENVANERIPTKQTVNKREEVLKAARSLFSKRTRTLYHWMYPDTSKGKLKAIVASAWDTLSNTEKEFYISQVLGRFGVPAGSLMVNPQLGGFQNREIVSSSYAILASANNTSTSDIDGNNSIQISSNTSSDEDSAARSKKRWRKDVDGNEVPARSFQHSGSTQATSTYDDDEFADDPELTTELMQFQRAMGHTE